MNITLLKKNILGSRLFLLSSVLAATIAVFVFFHIFLPVDRLNHTSIPFSIEKGQGSYHIARNLEGAGLIRSRAMFTLYAFFTRGAFKLQTGDYLLASSLSAHAILGKLVAGDIVKENITLKEGWDLHDIAKELEERGFFTRDEFFAVTGYPGADLRQETTLSPPKDFSGEFAFLKSKPSYLSLEGYLFPDTYQITANETPESLVRRMLKNFEAHLTPDVSFETIVLASLLEKEVRTFDDKKIVAGILRKRMENDMRLQADATVVYVREGNHYKVSIEETQVESPYNTYRVYGLPLGPIANPGLESIQAALEPEESPYWFYLSSHDGTTIFTRNFEEHKAAKAQYLQ